MTLFQRLVRVAVPTARSARRAANVAPANPATQARAAAAWLGGAGAATAWLWLSGNSSENTNNSCDADAQARHKYGIVKPMSGPKARGSIMVVSDIDRTLAHDKDPASDAPLTRFNKAWVERFGPRGDVLVFNTARPLSSSLGAGYIQLLEAIRERGGVATLIPDVLITSEGTEIYHFDGVEPGGDPYPDPEWETLMMEQWKEFDVHKVMVPHDECVWLSGIETSADDRYRFAITVTDASKAAALVKQFSQELGPNYLVASVPMTWLPAGHIIGALPAAGGKGAAAEFVVKKFGVDASRVVWAGDSENDLPMLGTPFIGVAVGNSTAGLKKAMCGGDWCDRRRRYQATASMADGVLEGLSHFGFGAH